LSRASTAGRLVGTNGAPVVTGVNCHYAGATGLARWCLASPKLEGVTIYSSKDAAAQDTFKLRRLE